MPPALPPLLCLWSPSAPDPACMEGWQRIAGDAAEVALPVTVGDPLDALRAATKTHPHRDLLLADARARVSSDGVHALLAAVQANPQFEVFSALGHAVAALDPLPGDSDSAGGEALCAGWGEMALFASSQWSPGMAYWRVAALRRIDALTSVELPDAVAGCVHGAVYVDSPRIVGFPDQPAPITQAIGTRLLPKLDQPGWMPAGRPVLLHILHGWGGGAERFVRDLIRADSARAHLVLIAHGSPEQRVHGQRLALHHDLDAPPLREWPLAEPIANTALHSPEYAALLAALIDAWGISAVLVSSLIGHSLDALRSGLPTAVCTHDYYPLWPLLHADFGDAAQQWDATALAAAVLLAAGNGPFAPQAPAYWNALRAGYLEALASADATMIAPSHGVHANQCRIAPALAKRTWQVIAHGIDAWPERAEIPASEPQAKDRLRVLVLGNIHAGKGEALLSGLIKRLAGDSETLPLEFTLLGCGDAGMRFFGSSNVHIVREYAHADLPRLIAGLRPDLALLPVSVAETWSYTLSELWSLNIPVLATRLGSLVERIQHGVSGLLVDPTAEAIHAALRQLVRDRSVLQTLHAPVLPSLDGMSEAWRKVLPASARSPAPALAATSQRMHSLANEAALLHAGIREAALREQTGAQSIEMDRRAAWATELETRLHESGQALKDTHAASAQERATATATIQQHEAAQRMLQSRLGLQQQQLDELALRIDAAQQAIRSGELALADVLRDAEVQRRDAEQVQTASAAHIAELQSKLLATQALLTQAETRALQTRHEFAELQRKLHAQHQLYAEDTVDLARQRDVAIGQRDVLAGGNALLLSSRSWRYTAPLRRLRKEFIHASLRLRFAWLRTRGMVSRTLSSLHRRGLGGTLQRARQELRASPAKPADAPRLSTDTALHALVLPTSSTPRASIVVPVYNHLAHTLACLQSLANSGDSTPFEVIVVDDASIDDSPQYLPRIEGLRYQRNRQNLGFIGACNAGAELARGEIIVFLNNDTVVQPGWLDALLRTFDEHPDAGLAGSKLVYPDGRLQEAGGIVFNDASGWNYGRFEDPADPRYNHVRDVDYCSGAAIALPTALFRRLGGFDTRYAPAYYEDTDLAMRVRAEGLRVLYQPASVVVHHEGVTAGTDINAGVKVHQAINQITFLERWRGTLATHPARDSDIRHASEHRATKRVLVIDACTPMPDRDSGSLRMFNLLRLLREEGHAVTFFADNLKHDGVYTQALQQLGVQAWWSPWLRDMPRWFAEHGRAFDLIIASRHYVASNYLLLARKLAPKARFVFDTVDLHYLREQREAELSGDPGQLRSAQHTRVRELKLIRDADLTLVVSPVEQQLLAREAPDAAVEILSNVHRAIAAQTPYAERSDLVFVGGYRHPPNADAAQWLAREIYPLIHAQRPEILLHLIGSDATPEILALRNIDGVQVHGHVPDLAPYMDGCRIGLAPLRYGAGVKGKINLSMVHGQPVVATAAAVEGMHLRDGEDVLVADDAQAFADSVLRLYDDRQLWETLARNGLANVEQHFSFDAARRALRRLLG